MHAEGWGWWGGSGGDKDSEEHKPVRLPVPKAKPEVDCVVRRCCLFYDGALLTGCSSRIVSIGNMVNGINRLTWTYLVVLLLFSKQYYVT